MSRRSASPTEKYFESSDPQAKRFNNLWITSAATYIKRVFTVDDDGGNDFGVVTLDYEDAQTLRHFLEHGFAPNRLYCPNLCVDTADKIRDTLGSDATEVHVSNETMGQFLTQFCSDQKKNNMSSKIGVFNLDYTCTWAGNKDMRPMHDVDRLFQIPVFPEVWMLCLTICTRECRCDSAKWCRCNRCEDYDSVKTCLYDVKNHARQRQLQVAVYKRPYGKNMMFLGYVLFSEKHRLTLQKSLAFQECDFVHGFDEAIPAPVCFLRSLASPTLEEFEKLVRHDYIVQTFLGPHLLELIEAKFSNTSPSDDVAATAMPNHKNKVKKSATTRLMKQQQPLQPPPFVLLDKKNAYKALYIARGGKMAGRPPLWWRNSVEKRAANKVLRKMSDETATSQNRFW